MANTKTPTELTEHLEVAKWLRRRGIFFHHSPNEAKRSVQQWVQLQRMGMVPGWPDFIIPGNPWLAIELKCRKTPSVRGGSFKGRMVGGGKVSPEQTECLRKLSELGVKVFIGYGAEETILWLQEQLLLGTTIKRIDTITT